LLFFVFSLSFLFFPKKRHFFFFFFYQQKTILRISPPPFSSSFFGTLKLILFFAGAYFPWAVFKVNEVPLFWFFPFFFFSCDGCFFSSTSAGVSARDVVLQVTWKDVRVHASGS